MKIRPLFIAALFCAIPAVAHHNVAEEFDISKTAKITGTVSNVEFRNPHVTFSLDVRNPDGRVARWQVETNSPNLLIRNGITKDLLADGAAITVDAYAAKDGSQRISTRTLTLTLPGGRELTLPAPTLNLNFWTKVIR